MPQKILAGGTALFTLAVLSIGVSACSSGNEGADEPMDGGMALCDEASLSAAISDNLAATESDVSLVSLDDFTCLDGWATTSPTIGNVDFSIGTTEVFQAEGQFWIPKDRSVVCGTPDMNDPTAYPADSQVPEGIYQDACQTN